MTGILWELQQEFYDSTIGDVPPRTQEKIEPIAILV